MQCHLLTNNLWNLFTIRPDGRFRENQPNFHINLNRSHSTETLKSFAVVRRLHFIWLKIEMLFWLLHADSVEEYSAEYMRRAQ